ncbi:MAG: fibrobacter succinogenes major paralogous domain-containing protein [Bacteroidales bacterium]|nr:fibrobacter succinogenes major paralogous domain-containing protein [Bacteroidales bacterium]
MKEIKFIGIILLISINFIGCEKDNNEINGPVPISSEMTNGKTTAVFNPDKDYGTMTDQDGNVYKTITIGTQTWMAENLRTTKYRDGSAIKMSNEIWPVLTEGAFCEYNSTTNPDSIATYGRLYNWHVISDSRNIAPMGWHLPSGAEWDELSIYLGGGGLSGGKMKEIGTTHWKSPNLEATNESGFTAIPGGYRTDAGQFSGIGENAKFWTSEENSANSGMAIGLGYAVGGLGGNMGFKNMGFSIRCIKD